MNKLFKALLIFLSSTVGLLLLAIILIPLIVDLNDYKPEISTMVKEKTGRTLTIEGDIDLSLFPWLGISTGKIILSNADSFKAKDFAVIEESHIKVKILPLLSKEVEVSTLVFKGLVLNLAKNKQGISNWDDLAGKKTTEEKPQSTTATEDTEKAGFALASLIIGGIEIENAQLSWDDQQAAQKVAIKDFNLKTGQIQFDELIDIELSLLIENNAPALTEQLALTTQLKLDESFQHIQLNNTQINSTSKGADIPNGEFTVQLLTDIGVDLSQETVALKPLTINFDSTVIKGSVQIKQFKQPAIQFNLAINELNVDRYSGPKVKTKKVATPAAAVTAASQLIPVKTIQDLNIDGKLTIEKLQASGLTLGQIALKLQAKDGIVKTEQSIKQLYQGQYKGQLNLNAQTNTPKIALNESITGVQIGQLLQALKPDIPAKVTGALNVNAKLNMRGNTVPQLKSALNGNLGFSLNNGAIQGINIQKMIDTAKLFSGKAMQSDYANEQTLFSSIKGTATVRRGVLNNPDFLMDSAQLAVNGKGTVNLVSEALNYQVNAKLKHHAANDRPVAIKVAGTISEPRYTMDILSMINKKEKEKLNKVLDKAIGKGAGKAVNQLLKGFF